MSNSEILDLKNNNAIICYIQLLQSNISRMSNHSGIIKASVCVIYTLLITLLFDSNKLDDYWWILIVVTLFCVVLDSYYLAIEKTYVIKYNNFINSLNNNEVNILNIYDMKPKITSLKQETLAMIFTSFFSISILGFYILFIFISILVMFL